MLTAALLLSGIPAEVINRSMDTYRRMSDVFADLCVYFFTFILSHEFLLLIGSETPWWTRRFSVTPHPPSCCPLPLSTIATRHGHLRRLKWVCCWQSGKSSLLPYDQGLYMWESSVCCRSLSHLLWTEPEKQKDRMYLLVPRMYSGIYRAEWYLFVRSSTENAKCHTQEWTPVQFIISLAATDSIYLMNGETLESLKGCPIFL